jgi:hypothetical protein
MIHYIGVYCFYLHIDLITRPFLDFVALRILKQFATEYIQFITEQTVTCRSCTSPATAHVCHLSNMGEQHKAKVEMTVLTFVCSLSVH